MSEAFIAVSFTRSTADTQQFRKLFRFYRDEPGEEIKRKEEEKKKKEEEGEQVEL